jgi:hypothetical protein
MEAPEVKSLQMVFWRETKEDQDIPITFYSNIDLEQEKKDLIDLDFDKHIQTIHKLIEPNFELKSIAYCKNHDIYV